MGRLRMKDIKDHGWGSQTIDDVETFLFTRSPALEDRNTILRAAAHAGLNDIVTLLIPNADPKANESVALRLAAQNGHLAVVNLLIPVCDPLALQSYALTAAAGGGYLDVVKVLTPVSRPADGDAGAMRVAARNDHLEVAKFLLKATDVIPIGKALVASHDFLTLDELALSLLKIKCLARVADGWLKGREKEMPLTHQYREVLRREASAGTLLAPYIRPRTPRVRC